MNTSITFLGVKRFKIRRTGMEPWFEFWSKVRYAVAMFRIEYANYAAYQANMGTR